MRSDNNLGLPVTRRITLATNSGFFPIMTFVKKRPRHFTEIVLHLTLIFFSVGHFKSLDWFQKASFLKPQSFTLLLSCHSIISQQLSPGQEMLPSQLQPFLPVIPPVHGLAVLVNESWLL